MRRRIRRSFRIKGDAIHGIVPGWLSRATKYKKNSPNKARAIFSFFPVILADVMKCISLRSFLNLLCFNNLQ